MNAEAPASGDAGDSPKVNVGVSSSLWTAKRVDLAQALAEQNALLGGLYRHAIDALGNSPWAMQHLVVAAHCLREIVNRLPDVLSDVPDLPTRADTDGPLRDLVKVWTLHETTLSVPPDGPPEMDGGPSEPERHMAVPVVVIRHVVALIEEHRRGSRNGHARRTALVLGRLEETQDPRVRLLTASQKFFQGFVHVDQAASRTLPPIGEVLRHLEQIEAIIHARLSDFFDTAEEIQGVIEAANRRGGGS